MSGSVASRVKIEKAAYNEGGVYARSARLHELFSHVFSCPNAAHADDLFDGILADIAKDKVVLEFGCFNGWTIPALAKCRPARIIGIDISENLIAQANEQHGAIAQFGVMDAHRLALASSSVDVVVGRAILHHLEFGVAMDEIRRVLKPGGHALFIEPLRDNPVGKLIRALTPKARTRDELPLSRRQIAQADALFEDHRHLFYGFMSVAFGMVSSLVSRNPANIVMRLAHRVDLKLAQTPLKHWMRVAVLHWTK